MRVKHDQTSCCLRPPCLGTPVIPSRQWTAPECESGKAGRPAHRQDADSKRCSLLRSVLISSIPTSFNLRASNPRTTAYLDLNMPFECSNLPGSGPILPDWTLKTGRVADSGHTTQHLGMSTAPGFTPILSQERAGIQMT